MIKFRTDGDRPLIGLGLSEANVCKLREGKPIYIMKEELRIDYNLLIFWGRTEAEMEKELKEIGAVTDKTDIKRGFVDN